MEWLSSTVTDCYSIGHQQTNPVLARNAGSGFSPQRWAARRRRSGTLLSYLLDINSLISLAATPCRPPPLRTPPSPRARTFPNNIQYCTGYCIPEIRNGLPGYIKCTTVEPLQQMLVEDCCKEIELWRTGASRPRPTKSF